MRKRLFFALLLPLALVAAGCGGRGARDIQGLLDDLMTESSRPSAERNLAEHGRAFIKPLNNIITGTDIEKTVKDYKIKADPATLRIPAATALGVIAAKASLARSEAETAAKPLLDTLNDAKAPLPLRVACADALGYFAQLSAPANDLVVLLRSPHQDLVDAAIGSLARNALQSVNQLVIAPEPPAPPAVKKDWARLTERLGSTDDDIRLDTVREIAASQDPRAVDLLLDRLASDKGREVRYAALRYCQRVAEGEPEGAFATRLYDQLAKSFEKDDDSRVVLDAAEILRLRKPDLVGQFLARVEEARQKSEERLLADAANDQYDAATRADAILALSYLPSPARDDLLAGFLDPAAGAAARVRRAAATVLASETLKTAAAQKALAQAMQDEDSIVKLIATQALGRGGNTDAVKYLVDLLSDPEAKIRTPAADALGTLGVKAIPVLVEQLNASLDKARELAQWEVPLRGLERETEPDSKARGEMARLRDAIAAFKKADPGRNEEYIAWGIVTGLGQIAAEVGPQAKPALDAIIRAAQCQYEDVRRVAYNALGNFQGEKAIQALAAGLQDPDEGARWYADAALEKRGDAALPALVKALGDEATEAIAARSLGRVGDEASLKPLLDRLPAAKGRTRADFVWAVGQLLCRFPASQQAAAARDALAQAAKDADAETASLARYALAKADRKAETPK